MPKIKINDMFSIERDKECWVLYEYTASKKESSRTGISERRRYYPSLHALVTSMMDIVPETASTLVELRDLMLKTRDDIFAALTRGKHTRQDS